MFREERNIVFVIESMAKKGGAERVLSNLANFLSAKGYTIIIAVNDHRGNVYHLDDSIELVNLRRNKNDGLLHALISLKRVNKKYRPFINIGFMESSIFKILLVNLFNRRKLIGTVRNDPGHIYKNWKNRILAKLLYHRIDGFVFQTEGAKEYFNNHIQKKSIIVHNPLSHAFLGGDFPAGKRSKTIVAVGKLEPQKNHELLISAFAEVDKKVRGYKLFIYGDGSLRSHLESKIRELGLANKVFMPGIVHDIQEKMYNASLFVLSSDYEGMPNVLMEAMALGLPCVSTDCPCGGPKELVKHGYNGILVPPADTRALANAMIMVLQDDKLSRKLSYNAKKITHRLHPDKINREWERYILSVIEG